jgi:hypothetical protein
VLPTHAAEVTASPQLAKAVLLEPDREIFFDKTADHRGTISALTDDHRFRCLGQGVNEDVGVRCHNELAPGRGFDQEIGQAWQDIRMQTEFRLFDTYDRCRARITQNRKETEKPKRSIR